MRMTEQLMAVATAYCEARELSLSRVSTLVLNDGKRLDAIKAGGDIATGKFEHAMAWFSANWPEKTAWPKSIARPVTAKAAS